MLNRLWIIGLLVLAACSGTNDNEDAKSDTQIKETIVNTEVTADNEKIEDVGENAVDQTELETVKNNIEGSETNPQNEQKPERTEVVVKTSKVEEITPVTVSSISFDQPIHKFSRAVEGAIIEHTFTFVNKGDGDLLIKNVIVDCGCTTPDYSKDAIAPGSKGEISVSFDTKGKLGSQSRMITVVTNGDPVSQILRLEGIVDTE